MFYTLLNRESINEMKNDFSDYFVCKRYTTMISQIKQLDLNNLGDDVLNYFENISQIETNRFNTRKLKSNDFDNDIFIENMSSDSINLLDFIDWPEVSRQKLSLREYKKYETNLRWDIVSEVISPKMAFDYFIDDVDWNIISEHNTIPENILTKVYWRIDLPTLISTQNVPEHIIEFRVLELDKIGYEPCTTGWDVLCQNKHDLSLDFLHKYKDKLNWEYICSFNNKLTVYFIKNHIQYVSLYDLELYGKITHEEYLDLCEYKDTLKL